ncbi:MAG TPA: SCP2 sterol-binding domain-containing protein [Acidimicrobiales bacterium]|jgi:predicted lipid carrier protein YhbT|nr:SCP2 sterol-binding domain-containing protein [Acidimicrobiales bacterium]
MAKWLSQEWFDEARALAADQPDRPGASARMQYEVTGGPDGDVKYYWVLEDGHLRESALGVLADAEVTLTTVWSDAMAIQKAELDANAAFMQGKVKVAGNMGTMLKLLPITNTAEYRDLQRRILAITDF